MAYKIKNKINNDNKVITLDPFTNKRMLKNKMPQAFLRRFRAHSAGLWNFDTLLHCPFEHPTHECLNKGIFFSILKSVHTSVFVFNNQPMLVLESIVSYKMCTVTSRDDSSSCQCFLFALVFAPCIILALNMIKFLFRPVKSVEQLLMVSDPSQNC